MVMTIARDGALIESTQRNIIPKERYVSQEFFDLEMERLWPRVWQMACREEEVPRTGDFLEYVIGDQSILVTRSTPDVIRAFYNTCPHRGTRLATGVGNFATGEIRCRYHAWRFEFDGTNKEVVDRFDFPPTMTVLVVDGSKICPVRTGVPSQGLITFGIGAPSSAEKSPFCTSACVGSVSTLVVPGLLRYCSQEKKKKVLLRPLYNFGMRTGPPRLPPKLF